MSLFVLFVPIRRQFFCFTLLCVVALAYISVTIVFVIDIDNRSSHLTAAQPMYELRHQLNFVNTILIAGLITRIPTVCCCKTFAQILTALLFARWAASV